MRLHNKVFVIIGGTTGLGLSAAKACIREGAKLVLVGLDDDSYNEARNLFSDTAMVIVADACIEETAINAIQTAHQFFNGFHGLYHVAGGSGRKFGDGPLHELTTEGWNKTMDWNLRSMMLSNRAAVQYFLQHQQKGVILNLSSVLSFSPSSTYFHTHAYAAAKSAIIGFSKSIAAYYAPHNIRVNVIAPGLVETPMSKRAAENAEIMQFIKTKQPLEGGRIGQPSDLDDAVVMLLSDGSSFITGQTIAIDGGWSISEGQHG